MKSKANPVRKKGAAVRVQRVVRRVVAIPATAEQWQPGATIENVYTEHDCQNIMGCKCKLRRRAFVNIGNATSLMCPGMWLVTDALGLTRIVKDDEMKRIAPNEELCGSAAKAKGTQ